MFYIVLRIVIYCIGEAEMNPLEREMFLISQSGFYGCNEWMNFTMRSDNCILPYQPE